jgi:hypothetical protein
VVGTVAELLLDETEDDEEVTLPVPRDVVSVTSVDELLQTEVDDVRVMVKVDVDDSVWILLDTEELSVMVVVTVSVEVV